MVSDEQLKKLYFTCRKLGFAYNQEMGQDFPGWAVETVIKRGYWVAPKYLLIDYLRDKFGRKTSPSREMRLQLRGLRGTENAAHHDSKEDKKLPAHGIDHNDLMDLLPKKDRIIRILFDKYGLNKTEIAYVMGVSLTNITQHLKKSIRVLKTVVRSDPGFKKTD